MWLNLAVQPCAMAMGAEHEHDCPHCPPASESQRDGHDMASQDVHDHTLPGDAMPCASEAGACSVFEHIRYDGRTAQAKLDDPSNDLPVAPLPIDATLRNARARLQQRTLLPRRLAPEYPQRLNKLYCVYLK